LLESAEKNLANESELRLFEIGKVFLAEKPGPRVRGNRAELLPRQDNWLAALHVSKKDSEPFWAVRRAAEAVFAALRQGWELAPAKDVRPWEHPARAGKIKIGAEEYGQVFEVNPQVAGQFGIEARVGVLEVNLTKLADLKDEKPLLYESVPVYPDMERDLAFLVAKKITHQEIIAELLGSDSLLKKVELFDTYAGANIGENKKSLAYHFVFRHPERTLKTEEVDEAMKKIKRIIKEKFGAEIRE
jgi:phenylalanyl-tRNA synthetase beta chain